MWGRCREITPRAGRPAAHRVRWLAQRCEVLSPVYLPYISCISPLYLPYISPRPMARSAPRDSISPISRLYLPYISPISRRVRWLAQRCEVELESDALARAAWLGL